MMLECWLGLGVLGRTSKKGPNGNGGSGVAASRSLEPMAASLPVSFSLTVCSERSSRANCTVNHDCFFTTPLLTLEGFEPIVGGWTLFAAIWSCVVSPFLVEPGTSCRRSGFIVVTLAQTMPVLTSIMDQKSIATLLYVQSVPCLISASSVRRMMETIQMLLHYPHQRKFSIMGIKQP